MTQRKGRSAPVVAAGAVVAVAAADVVRRRWQGRAVLTPAPAFVAGPGPVNESTTPDTTNAPSPTPLATLSPTAGSVPKHRAAEPEVVMSQADHRESAAPEPVAPESVAPESVPPESVPPEPVAPEAPATEPRAFESEAPVDNPGTPSDPIDPEEGKAPDWWHRGHPTFSALTGFFAGIAFLVVVPGLYAGILAQLVDYERAEQLFPFVLLTLIVPIVLLTIGKTRRFALFMLVGLVSTLVVVGGVTALVLYVLFAMN